MPAPQSVLLYVTAKDKAEAIGLAKALLEARLIACANLFPINSIYHWEGKLEENTEYALVVKTVDAHVKHVINTVNTLHSYSCPCVVALPITDGNPAFLNWIMNQTYSSS